MLKNSNLRNYIKLIIESIEDNEEESNQQSLEDLESKYRDDIFQKNMEEYEKNQSLDDPTSPQGWNLLNHTIRRLRDIDQWFDPKTYNISTKFNEIEDILVDELNFDKVGEGSFRKVFSRQDAMFIVKLEKEYTLTKKSVRSGTNKVEFDKYFDFGEKYQKENIPSGHIPIINHSSIFPKIYAYDNLDGMWIITEKVIPVQVIPNYAEDFKSRINNSSTALKMFKPFHSFLIELFNFLDNDPSLISNDTGHSIFEIRSDIKRDYTNINSNDHALYLFEIFLDFILNVSYSHESNLNQSFQNAIINRILASWSQRYTSIDDFKKDNPTEYQLLVTRLNAHFGTLKPTPDIEYICNILKKEYIDDFNAKNVGFRDMKLNPSEPWKNFVVLDYAAFGGPTQDRT